MALDHADKSAERWSLCDSVGRSRMPTCEGKCPNLPPLGGTRLDGGGWNPPPSSPLYVYPVPPPLGYRSVEAMLKEGLVTEIVHFS